MTGRKTVLSSVLPLLALLISACASGSYWDDDDYRYSGRRYQYYDRYGYPGYSYYDREYRNRRHPDYDYYERLEWERRRRWLERQEEELAEERAKVARERRELRRDREETAKGERETQRAERREERQQRLESKSDSPGRQPASRGAREQPDNANSGRNSQADR